MPSIIITPIQRKMAHRQSGNDAPAGAVTPKLTVTGNTATGHSATKFSPKRKTNVRGDDTTQA